MTDFFSSRVNRKRPAKPAAETGGVLVLNATFRDLKNTNSKLREN